MIYFVTVNYFSTDLVNQLIRSLPENSEVSYQVIIVNNSPDDASIKQLKTDSILILEAKTNLGFGRACNLGLNWVYKQDNEAIAWIINPDSYLLEKNIEKVPAFFKAYPELSIVGTLIYIPTGEVWFGGGRFIPGTGTIFSENLLLTQPNLAYVPCDWVSGCSLLLNLRKFPSCPEFDPAYFLYYEDFDFCRRYSLEGHLIAITPLIRVGHQPSSITNRNIFIKIKYSTYSYLLTLEKYVSLPVRSLRFLRLIFHAFMLLVVKPSVALGKLYGVFLYLKKRY
ncbi:glycosyltransferase family 2 protein [Coleofasciculus sp. FACHB-712]|uniref:glycosyltransferase n=1 Tax=Coleofasciculus sp. FACHB-712 TaxID=2692789 RepID=UPI0016866EA1|nr:glycosyltransferase family 2 protein [Coleofasciculus sp. FACHB-712]